MKQLATIILFSGLLAQTSNAQYGYLRLGGGYSGNAFQKTGQVLGFQPGTTPDPSTSLIVPMFNQLKTGTDTASYYKANVNDGYARGGSFSIFGGYMINPYFGVEMGLTYLVGAKITSTNNFNDPALLGNNATITTKTNSNGLSLMPGVYIRGAKPESKLAPFARLGLSLPVYGATYHSLIVDAPKYTFGVLHTQIDVKTESTISLGVNGALGLSYSPIPLLSIFAEMNGQYLFVRPQKSTLTKYTLSVDGVETKIPSTYNTTYCLETEYVDKLTPSSNTQEFGKIHDPSGKTPPSDKVVDETKPRQVLRSSANFSAIGFSVGISFNMSKTIFKNLNNSSKKANKVQ